MVTGNELAFIEIKKVHFNTFLSVYHYHKLTQFLN